MGHGVHFPHVYRGSGQEFLKVHQNTALLSAFPVGFPFWWNATGQLTDARRFWRGEMEMEIILPPQGTDCTSPKHRFVYPGALHGHTPDEKRRTM